MSDETAKRPGGLTAICIIALSLGILGACCSFWNGLSLFNMERMEAFNHQNLQHIPDPLMRQGQQDMQDAMNAVVNKWLPFTTAATFIAAIVAILLAAGGGLSLGLKSGGRMLLMAVCVIAPLAEVGRLVIESLQSFELMPVMQQTMTRALQVGALEGGHAAPSGMGGAMGTAMGVGGAVGVAIGGTWALAKIVYFVVTFLYLRRPEIRALYG